MQKTGRNDPCPCGSGKKFKKCCEKKMIGKKFMATRLDTTSKVSNALGGSFFGNQVTESMKNLKAKLSTSQAKIDLSDKKGSEEIEQSVEIEQVEELSQEEASQEMPASEDEIFPEKEITPSSNDKEEKKEPNEKIEEKESANTSEEENESSSQESSSENKSS